MAEGERSNSLSMSSLHDRSPSPAPSADPSDNQYPSQSDLRDKLEASAHRKKPLNADCQDLHRLWQAISVEIAHAKKQVLAEANDNFRRLHEAVEKANASAQQGIEDAAQGRKLIDTGLGSLQGETDTLKTQVAKLTDLDRRLSDVQLDLGSQIGEVESHARQLIKENFEHLRSANDLAKRNESRMSEAEQKLKDLQQENIEALANLRRKLSSSIDDVSRQDAAARGRQEAAFLERLENISTETVQARQDLQKKFSTNVDKAVNGLERKLESTADELSSTHDRERDSLRREYTELSTEMKREMLHLSRAVSGVANIPTRRVEWVVQDAAAKLERAGEEPLEAGDHISVLSKQFEMVGLKGFRFELLRYGGSNLDSACSNDCELRISAAKGLHVIFRAFVGDVIMQFDHYFEDDEWFSTGRFCSLTEQIRPDDGTIHVGVDILEAFHCQECSSSLAAMGVPELDHEETGDANSFMFHRYLNHRMLDLVQNQIDVLNSRVTRRVEWHIENASRLPACFAQGESMCSSIFQAAGLEGLQFVFYPNGSFGAKDGYCSCFLFYPGRTSLRCWLSVGNQRREAKLSFTSAGFFGRTNFCRLENGIDASADTVCLVVEIAEAEQDTMRHACQPANHTLSLAPGAATSQVSAEQTVSQGVLKMQKVSGPYLQEVKHLPSIWTPTPQLDVAHTLEGFHSIKDLPTKRRPPGRMDHPSGAPSDASRLRPGTLSSMSMYSQSDRDTSRPESRQQRPGSRIDRAQSPDRQGAASAMSLYSDSVIQACPPASARPQKASVRDALSQARYAAYMG